ncbi:MAG: glycoside hydrolase family 95 protein [Roseiflexaceae bacterium]
MTADQFEHLLLWYQQPAQRWVEALPLGNGRLGAMVFGGTHHERIALNEDTLWSGGPSNWNNPNARIALPEVRRLIAAGRYAEADRAAKAMQGAFTQSYMPLGDLLLDLDLPAGAIEGYRRSLDLDRATTTTSFQIAGVTFTQQAFVSAPAQLIVIELSCDQPGQLNLTARLTSQLHHQANASGDQIILLGQAPRHVAPSYDNVPDPVIYDQQQPGIGMHFGVVLQAYTTDGTISTNGDQLTIRQASRVTLRIAAGTSFAGFQHIPGQTGIDPLARAHADLQRASSATSAELHAAHIVDHQQLFRRVMFDLGRSAQASQPTDQRLHAYRSGADPHMAVLLFQYGRYLLIASSRPGSQAANLQGIWNAEVRPPWSSNWTININTEMNYWPAEPTNLAECHAPLFDLIAGLAENGQQTAQINYGCNGWVAHHNADIWCHTGPVGDFGRGDPVWAFWPMAAPWLCQHLWEHYAFGGDLAFLRERGYPLMRGAAEFCLDWLIEDDQGYLITSPSTSPENKFITPDGQEAAVSANSTMDNHLIWDLFSNCIAASEVLGEDTAFRERLVAARARLRPLAIGQHGQLQEWMHDWDRPDDTHRHCSQIFGLHPGNRITRNTPELREAVRRSLEMRGDAGTGWSIAWKIAFWARLHDGDHALKLIDDMLTLTDIEHVSVHGGGVYANLFCAHPPFQIDGNFGATAAIAEMLLQSHAGEIELLPALPSTWSNGRISGLRARGGLTIDLAWQQGALSSARVHTSQPGTYQFRIGDTLRSLSVETAGTYQIV